MPNIKPVSDLRNYNEVLRDIAVGEPFILTKNGRGRYDIVDMEEYTKRQRRLSSWCANLQHSFKWALHFHQSLILPQTTIF